MNSMAQGNSLAQAGERAIDMEQESPSPVSLWKRRNKLALMSFLPLSSPSSSFFAAPYGSCYQFLQFSPGKLKASGDKGSWSYPPREWDSLSPITTIPLLPDWVFRAIGTSLVGIHNQPFINLPTSHISTNKAGFQVYVQLWNPIWKGLQIIPHFILSSFVFPGPPRFYYLHDPWYESPFWYLKLQEE